MNKKGYTLIEVLFASMLASFVILSAIIGPQIAMKQLKRYEEVLESRYSFQTFVVAFNKDLSSANGNVRYDGEYIIIRNYAYEFREDGVYRIHAEKTQKISSLEIRVVAFEEDYFEIETIDHDPDKCIRLTFNKRYSSFDRGGEFQR